jgi:HPt (histidine-containing phosphotransfer) domain-containing protein
MDDYLAKPVSIPLLAACLGKWLPQAGPGAAATTPAPVTALPQTLTPPLPLQAAVIEQLTGGRPAEAAALLGEFLAATAEDLAAMQRAREAGDPAELARQAHRISGSSRAVGASELAQAARALETAAKAADWGQMAPLCADVQTCAERLRLYIQAHYRA